MARKTDRRTLYTQGTVKDALVELVKERGFANVTVTALCQRAQISRSTFYLHFSGIGDVLDATVDEALEVASEDAPESSAATPDAQESTGDLLISDLPICQRISSHEKYRPLFTDPALSRYLIGRLYDHEAARTVPTFARTCNISEEEADKLLRFLIHGSFAVNEAFGWRQSDAWRHMQGLIVSFVNGGVRTLSERSTTEGA